MAQFDVYRLAGLSRKQVARPARITRGSTRAKRASAALRDKVTSLEAERDALKRALDILIDGL